MSNLRFLIFDAVSLVDDNVAPVEFFEDSFFSDTHFIGCYAHIPLSRHENITNEIGLI